MPVQTVAGTEISLSAGPPATFNAVGYAALTYTKVGEITDGGAHGKTYAPVTHMPIDTRAVQKFKGSFDNGDKTIQMAVDREDGGQVLAKTALDSDADYSVKVEYQDGAIDYFQAKVMSFSTATAGVDTIVAATMTLALTATKTGVGIIEVDAP